MPRFLASVVLAAFASSASAQVSTDDSWSNQNRAAKISSRPFICDGNCIVSGSTVSVGAGGLNFPDGSVQTTAFTSGSALSRSSAVVVPNTSFSNQNFGACIATATLTTRGFPVMVTFAAAIENTTANIDMGATFLVDGAPPPGFVTVRAIGAGVAAQGGDDTNMNFSFMLSGVSAGSHNFCLTVKTTANTGTILSSASYIAQFAVREFPQ